MEYNHGTQTPNNGSNSNDTIIILGVTAITLGLVSLLFTLCVPWLTWLLSAIGLACGIIAWVQSKQQGKPLVLPIVGTIISGVTLTVATITVITYHIAFAKLQQNYEEMEQQYRNMRDSLQQWDTLYFPDGLPEPDSTFFIE